MLKKQIAGNDKEQRDSNSPNHLTPKQTIWSYSKASLTVNHNGPKYNEESRC